MKNPAQLAHTFRRLIKKYYFQIILFQSRLGPEIVYSYGDGSYILSNDFNLVEPYRQNLFLKLRHDKSIDEYEEYLISKGYSYAIFENFEEGNKKFHKITRSSNQESLHLTSIQLEDEFKGKKYVSNKDGFSSIVNKLKKNDLFFSAILKGIDPITGEILLESSVWLHPRIKSDIKEHIESTKNDELQSQAPLYEYKGKKFDDQKSYRKALTQSPEMENAYKPWTPEEDELLISYRHKKIIEIAAKHKRGLGAIKSRLNKLDGKNFDDALNEENLKKSFDEPKKSSEVNEPGVFPCQDCGEPLDFNYRSNYPDRDRCSKHHLYENNNRMFKKDDFKGSFSDWENFNKRR